MRQETKLEFNNTIFQQSSVRMWLVFNASALLFMFGSNLPETAKVAISSIGFILHLVISFAVRHSNNQVASFRRRKPDKEVRAAIFRLTAVALVLVWLLLSITFWFRYLSR